VARKSAGRDLTVVRQADGFVITGRGLIASPGRADLFVVMAPVDDGCAASSSTPVNPVSPSRSLPDLGHRGADLRHVELTGCLVPPAQALGGDLIPEPRL
jgi:alkylation response protein AidB-like acyl-CoA dehydrogenase